MSSLASVTGTTTSSAPAPSPGSGPGAGTTTAPVLQNQIISLDINGIDAKTAPTIEIEVTKNAAGELKKIDFIFEGTKQLNFNPDGSVNGYDAGRKAIYTIEDNTPSKGMHALDEAAANEALAMFVQAAALLKGSLHHESSYEAAKQLIENGVNKLHRGGKGAELTALPSSSITDPRLIEAKAVVDARGDLEALDTRTEDTAPQSVLTNLALGIERIAVRSKGMGADGDVHQVEIETSVFGVDVTQRTLAGPDRKEQQVITARLEKSARFDAGDLDGIVTESVGLAEALTGDLTSNPARASILPKENSALNSENILGSDEGFELARLGAISYCKDVVVAGKGHLHEKVDARGALMENLTVEDGVYQLEGKLLKGSKITVKAGATLMLDLHAGSEVELIIEPGGKVMSGPGGLGIKGCLVSGRIQGDLSQLDLKAVTWGNNPEGKPMTWKDFKGMIYDTNRCDQASVELFLDKSSAFNDVEGLLKVDRQNLSMSELRALLGEKFAVTDTTEGFIVEGRESHRGSFVGLVDKNDPAKGVWVMPVIGVPGSQVEKIDDKELQKELVAYVAAKEKAKEKPFSSEHNALLAVLRQRNGGYGTTGATAGASLARVGTI